MSAAVAFLIGYFVAMLGIGFWAARRTGASDEEYLLGGRRLGPAVTALRLQSTSMSGYMFAGAGPSAPPPATTACGTPWATAIPLPARPIHRRRRGSRIGDRTAVQHSAAHRGRRHRRLHVPGWLPRGGVHGLRLGARHGCGNAGDAAALSRPRRHHCGNKGDLKGRPQTGPPQDVGLKR